MANNYEELVAELRKMQSVEYCVIASTEEHPAIKIVDEAADAIEELQGKYFMMKKTAEWLAEKVPKWIPVTERLPLLNTPVLATDGIEVDISWMYGVPPRWITSYTAIDEDKLTHWMPLPQTPRVDPCADCVHYPPSSTDGKPCCACDPDNPLTNCHEAKEKP